MSSGSDATHGTTQTLPTDHRSNAPWALGRPGDYPPQLSVAFEAFKPRTGIEKDDRFVRLNPAGSPEFTQGNATSRTLRSQKQALSRAHHPRRINPRFTNRDGGAFRGAHRVQDEKIPNGFGNPKARGFGRSIQGFRGKAFALRMRGDDRLAPRRLNRNQPRPA